MCEQTGTGGNVKQDDLTPIEYIDGYESGELKELLTPARGEEKNRRFPRALSFHSCSSAGIWRQPGAVQSNHAQNRGRGRV